MKRAMTLILAVVMVLSLAACGGTGPDADGMYYFGDDRDALKEVKSMNKLLMPTLVYSNLTYTEEMFSGSYELREKDKNEKKFLEKADFADLEYVVTYNKEAETRSGLMSTLPVAFDAGYASVYAIRNNSDEHWMQMTFLNTDGNEINVLGTYEVTGNKLIFTPLDYFLELRDEESYYLGFEYAKGEDSLEFTFEFSGVNLTLTRDGKKVTLTSTCFAQNIYEPSMGGYLVEGSDSAAGIDSFFANEMGAYIYPIQEEGKKLYPTTYAIAMNEDGWIGFYWEDYYYDGAGNRISTTHKEEFIYFPGDGYTCVLTDGKNVYYYTDNFSNRNSNQIWENVSEADQDKLGQLSNSELDALAQKQVSLLDDLAKAYQDSGLNVTVDSKTGEIALDAAVLFDVDESAISDEGKAFLQQFMQIYTSVVFDSKYENFVSQILVEGHTDTSGTYEHNLVLSQARADSVKDYCLSSECGVDAYTQKLEQMLVSAGYSYERPVLDQDGNVDMDASRRVGFRFLINLDQ